jgi:peptide/nickel transport system substrate-binding protein
MRTLSMIVVICATLAIACGGQQGTAPPAAAPATGGGASPVAVAQPRGELKVAIDFLAANLDANRQGTFMTRLGLGETLTRLTADLKVEPWLAERVTNVDPTTWRVTLRPNATFHDGSPVDAEAVIASFRRNWELQPAANGFISKDTVLTAVDARTVEFKTPVPTGAFVNNLAAFQFVVSKPGPENVSIMTGPFKPVRLVTDESVQLEAFTNHWAGPPAIARVSIRLVRDPNARVLALQSGDVDMIVGSPAELLASLPPEIERAVTPSTRIQYMMFNHTRPLFQDRAVREAISLGVDRAVLNRVGFEGISTPVGGVIPPLPGLEAGPSQTSDPARARQVLDAAGWVPGGDGVRVKDGRRLAFTVLSYPQRADLGVMATAIQGQLRALGIEVRTEQVQDIGKPTTEGSFEATMYSVNLLPTGDPLYAYNVTLATGGDFNFGKYSNPRFDELTRRMRDEVDPARRAATSRELQEIIRTDVPNAYLVAFPLAYAYRKGKVSNFTPHPSDFYFLNGRISVQ